MICSLYGTAVLFPSGIIPALTLTALDMPIISHTPHKPAAYSIPEKFRAMNKVVITSSDVQSRGIDINRMRYSLSVTVTVFDRVVDE